MACGTPVTAFDCGSAPEIIDHGVTGFIVGGEEEAIEAAGRVDTLDRREVRRRFERRFSSLTMARGYLDLYAERMARGRAGRPQAHEAAGRSDARTPAPDAPPPLASAVEEGENAGILAHIA
jgi:hypothetical protein